ncbi:uncharacterized protein LOC133900542 [Phragmites australis]|uniref:uncharacterized protein LOC133900542 n=1 Tax=Phragmites australis TaxID=29695 RepID=UPI002D79CEA7|nr:uncharacterized protein LOC133900542 [Phragmites australis]
MKRQTRMTTVPLLLVLYVAAALIVSRGVGAVTMGSFLASSEATPMHALHNVEDEVMGFMEGVEKATYPQRRVLYDGGHISYAGLMANKQVCNGGCAAPGQPYSTGCLAIYQCHGGM